MFSMVERRVTASAQILDIACGTGVLAIHAAERARRERSGSVAGCVTATDFSPGMVAFTRSAGEAVGLGPEVLHCEVQNGEALDYADGTFDAVFSAFGIFLFENRAAGWSEAGRVLRPGGTFATAVWQGPEQNQMLRAQVVPVMKSLPPHLMPQQGARSWLEVSQADALLAEVTASGPFVDVGCHTFRATIALPNARTTWEGMVDNPAIGALLRACNPRELAVVEQAVLESLHELSGGPDRPLLLDSACNIVIATRS